MVPVGRSEGKRNHPLWLDKDHDLLLCCSGLFASGNPVEVLLGGRVDKTEGAIFINTCDRASNLQSVVRIGRIGDGNGDPWLTQEIAVLLAAFVQREQEMGSIPGESDCAHLRLSW